MAEQLFVSEGHIVDSSGDRIATLTELAESERITALEERVAALENAGREPTPQPLTPGTVVEGEPVHEPPATGTSTGSTGTVDRRILVGDEVGIPEAPDQPPPEEPSPEGEGSPDEPLPGV